jgi:hypothetical protein
MQDKEEVREDTGFASSPILNMSAKTQAGIVAGFLGVPALILADMALGLADWMVVPEVAGVALVAGIANYALKKNDIDLKSQWRDLDWGSLVGAPRSAEEEVIEEDDLPSFKLGPVVEPVDPVREARQRIVPPGQSRAPLAMPTSKMLDLGDVLQLDIDDLVCKSIFVCGIKRSGKTTLGCRLIEQMAPHQIPMFIVDLKRDYLSLKDILPRPMVLDRRTDIKDAKRIAASIFEENYQVILDLASFIEDFDKGCEIAVAIVHELISWARDNPESKRCCELVIDECQAFFPQSGNSVIADSKIYQSMLSVYAAAIARGGSLGLGTIALTQRMAETDKKIIGQSELYFLLKQTFDNDLKRYQDFTSVPSAAVRAFAKGQGIYVDYEGESLIVQFHNRTSDGSMSASPRASSVLKPLSRPVTRQNYAYASEEQDRENFRRKMREEKEGRENLSLSPPPSHHPSILSLLGHHDREGENLSPKGLNWLPSLRESLSPDDETLTDEGEDFTEESERGENFSFSSEDELQVMTAAFAVSQSGKKVTRGAIQAHLGWNNRKYDILKAICDKNRIA